MNTKTILSISIAAIFVASAGFAYAHVTWHTFGNGTVSVTSTPQTVALSLTANAAVPQQTDDLAGFLWPYSSSSGGYTGFAITTHNAGDINGDTSQPPNDARDSTQNPDGWHAHNVKLSSLEDVAPLGPTPTPGDRFCVDDLSDDPPVGISFKQNGEVNVKGPASAAKGTFAGVALSFDIVPDLAGAECASTNGSAAPLIAVVEDGAKP